MKENCSFHTRTIRRGCIMTRLLVLCIATAVLTPGVSLAQETSLSGNPPGAKILENRVSELLRLELDENEERTAWREQSGRMDAMLALLRSEKDRLKKAIESFEAEEKEERIGIERESDRIATMKASLAEVAKSSIEGGRDILREYDELPAPLRELLKNGARHVRACIEGEASADNAVERLRTVVAFSHDMQRILSEIHAVSEVVEIERNKRLEVDVLYLGGTVGFYLSPDRKRAGVLRRSRGGWTSESHDEIAPRVALALEVKRKETSPRLVALPLDPPEVKEDEHGE